MADNKKNTKAITAGAVLAVALAAIAVQLSGGGGNGRVTGDWYYDMSTGERFVGSPGQLPPISSTSGGEAVRALVFACGSCDDAAGQFVGHLERYPEEARSRIQVLRQQRDAAAEGSNEQVVLIDQVTELERVSLEVRAVDGDRWINSQHPDAGAIYSAANQQCTGEKKLRQCQAQ